MAANVTLREFLDGETLAYHAPIKYDKRGKPKKYAEFEATYRAGVGIFIERQPNGEDEGCADVTDDLGASRVYWNMTRGTDGEGEEEKD